MDYLERARNIWRSAVSSQKRPPTDRAVEAPESSDASRAIEFGDPTLAARDPRSWVELFDRAVLQGAPVSDNAIRVMYSAVGRSGSPDPAGVAAIRHIAALPHQPTLSGERFGPLLRELGAPEVLAVVLLMRRSVVPLAGGAEALGRLQLSGDARKSVEFLLAHGAEMARLAFRRDAGDVEVIRGLASLVANEDRLKMLTLLTLGELAAAPGMLTPWKEELLWRLYVDTYNELTMAYADETIEVGESMLATLRDSRPEDISAAELDRFVSGLPRRYLTMFDRDDIYRHVRLWRNIAADDVHYFLKPGPGMWELTVATLDKPYLFSNICGTLSYFGMNILRGHALTSRGSLVLDVFQFADPGHVLDAGPDAQADFGRLLTEVVGGRVDIAALLDERRPPVAGALAPPVIYFDNASSRRYTILELVADDRPGLLHGISRAVSRHGFDVELVLISTEADKAIDVFHLKKGSMKLTDADQLALTADLEGVLGGGGPS